jgi:hypothetical protein
MTSDAATSQLPHKQGTPPSPEDSCATVRWQRPTAVATALLLTALLAACGSSHSSPSTSSASAQVKQTCRQIEGVLSNGPDPEADPVGYAQAQILPLRQIDTSNEQLHEEIDGLASAYEAFSATKGASSAKTAVSAASKALENICPGVAS